MAARLHAFYDQGIGAGAHQLVRKRKGRRETQHLCTTSLDAGDLGGAR